MKLLLGDCLDKLKELEDNSIDSIVTDPPYGLSFMGKKWDYDVPKKKIWKECMRVLKPGGYLLAFAGSRTYHRMAIRIENAGFEIRDQIMWVYGSGFPKSMDISKQIDKRAGAEREVIGTKGLNSYKTKEDGQSRHKGLREDFDKVNQLTAPATDEAKKWNGWGTALKPAHEPIVMARKPFKGNVANNVLEWGTGGINIDGCRIEGKPRTSHKDGNKNGNYQNEKKYGQLVDGAAFGGAEGRFPANIIFDEEAGKMLPDAGQGGYGEETTSSASRFFYCPKTSKSDRSDGNNHPTVKPTDLMAYLIRLVTPKGGVVLDPFMGSGSTGKAAVREGMEFIGIEREEEYFQIAEGRINYEINKPTKTTKSKVEVKPEVVDKLNQFFV